MVSVRVGDRSYEINSVAGESVLGLLRRLVEENGETIAFDYCCSMGRCGLCKMLINGSPALACLTPVESGLQLSHWPRGRFIRDLLTMDEEVTQSDAF